MVVDYFQLPRVQIQCSALKTSYLVHDYGTQKHKNEGTHRQRGISTHSLTVRQSLSERGSADKCSPKTHLLKYKARHKPQRLLQGKHSAVPGIPLPCPVGRKKHRGKKRSYGYAWSNGQPRRTIKLQVIRGEGLAGKLDATRNIRISIIV